MDRAADDHLPVAGALGDFFLEAGPGAGDFPVITIVASVVRDSGLEPCASLSGQPRLSAPVQRVCIWHSWDAQTSGNEAEAGTDSRVSPLFCAGGRWRWIGRIYQRFARQVAARNHELKNAMARIQETGPIY